MSSSEPWAQLGRQERVGVREAGEARQRLVDDFGLYFMVHEPSG